MLSFSVNRSLKSNFGYALLGNFGYAGFQYLILTILVKVYSDQDMGIFHYANAFVMPIALAFDLQLRSLYITGTEEGHFKSYLRYRRYLNVMSVVVIAIVAYAFEPEYALYILLLGGMKLIENQVNLYYGLYHKVESLKRVAYSRWIRSSSAFLVVLILSLWLKPSFIWIITAYAAAYALSFVIFDYRWMRHLLQNIPDIQLSIKDLVKLTWPMMIIVLIEKYYVNYPRLAIEELFGLEIIGIIGTLLYIRMIGSQVVTALSFSVQARFGELIKQQNKTKFHKLVFQSVMIGLVIGIGLLLVFWIGGETLLPILFSDSYLDYQDELMWVLLGSSVAFAYTFLGGALVSMRLHQYKFPLQAVAFAFLGGYVYVFHSEVNDILIGLLLAESLLFLLYFLVYIWKINVVIHSHKGEESRVK